MKEHLWANFNKRSFRVHQDLLYSLISHFCQRSSNADEICDRGVRDGSVQNVDPSIWTPYLTPIWIPIGTHVFFFKKIRVKLNDGYMIGKPNTWPSLKMTIPRYIADHVKTTGHNIKWNHFDILAKGKTDYHCKIRDLFMQELSPAFNVNI